MARTGMKKREAGGNAVTESGDRTVGMDRDITRRDFLNATLLASGGLLLNPVSPAELIADQKAAQKAAQEESP